MATPSFISVDKHRNVLQGIILTAVYCKHNTAIHRAVEVIRKQKLDEKDKQKGGKQSLDFLPSKHAQVNPEYRSHSPLMLACQRGDIDRVRLLLDEGASAAFKNKEGLNALHIACNTGNLEICKLLLDKANNQNRFGINKQYTSDISILVNAKEKRGWTPLMYAVKGDHLDIVTELEDTDVLDYSVINKKGANFLHVACSEGSDKTLRHIIGDPPPLLPNVLKELFMATDKNGWNIIHYACSNRKSPNLTESLLKNMTVISDEDKSDLLKQKTKAGYSPFLTACEYQKVDAVNYLVGRSDVDVSDFVEESSYDGERTGEKSALHIAAIHDSAEIAKALLDKGCKADRKDIMGNTVLHVARAKSSERVEKVILATEHGKALHEEKNQAGQSPRDVEPEDIIPPEIVKRGSVFIESYKQALRQGKKKIPRCGLLFLGEARKGKTSLYKLIVGKEFDPNQKSTRGIDNNEVDTVDSRAVTMQWSETSEGDQQRERDEMHALAIIKGLPEEVKKQAASQKFQEKSLGELLRRIEDINTKINKETKPLVPKINLRKERDPILDSYSFLSSDPRPSNTPTDQQVKLAPVENSPSPPPVLNSSAANTLIAPEKIEFTPKPPSKPQVPKVSQVKKSVSQPLPVSTKIVPPERSISVCSRLEAKIVNNAFKNRKHLMKDTKPTLILNVLDFAGQENYRPMHHCFIRRRSMYIVVFNLQDMREYLLQPNFQPNPMEEVRYWLHSIHAHISPPEPNENEETEDKYQRRVVLVGTHRNPGIGKEEITQDQLKEINKEVRKVLVEDDRCVNHLCKINGRYFIAVENSVTDPINSGALEVRSTLDGISKKLKFLNEVYPLSWLRLEGKLKEMKNDIKREKKKGEIERCCRKNEMIKIAERKGVPHPTNALEFFHDVGEIILLDRVSKLLLSEKDAEKINELVIIDPKMLIEIMKIIMELSKDSDNILSGKEERNLQSGIISFAVLERLCQQILKSDIVDATTLSVILQAYCLIHPTSGNDSQADSASCHSDSPTNKCFVIPSMLPELQDDMIEELAQSTIPWMEFYFDFEKFLPMEVYHRLVCMLMAAAQKHRRRSRVSRFLCCFDMVHDCKWKVQLEVLQHRIKISVRVLKGKKPSECIQLIHDEYLKRICQESGFQGLKYRAGPMLLCHCPQPSVFTFVAFDDNEPKIKVLFGTCPKCLDELKGSGSISEKVDAILQEQIGSQSSPETQEAGGLKTVTIEELKERTKVTDSQLNGQIDEKDMLELSNHFGNVEDYILYLELTPSQQRDVRDLAVRRNTQSAVAEALRLWRKRNPFAATYRALIEIVLNANEGQLAIDIFQHLCRSSSFIINEKGHASDKVDVLQEQIFRQSTPETSSASKLKRPILQPTPLPQDVMDPLKHFIKGTDVNIDAIGTAQKELASNLNKTQLKEYLPGVEAVAHTQVIVTNSSQIFHWDGYGFELHISQDSLPSGVNQCQLDIVGSAVGQYQFPGNLQLVSGIFWIRSHPPIRFKKLMAVRIQHCAAKTTSSTKLSFVRAHCSQASSLPYTFQQLKERGTFIDSYGQLMLNQFSGLAVTGDDVERVYTASLYYLGSELHSREIHFVVNWDNDIHKTRVNKEYSSKRAILGVNHFVEFEGDSLTLDIPMAGAEVNEGWKITPMFHPTVLKKHIDQFKPDKVHGQRIPYCQLNAEMSNKSSKKTTPKLFHQVKLLGAKHPYNIITFNLDPYSSYVVPQHRNSSPLTVQASSELTLNVLNKELKTLTQPIQFGLSLGISDHRLEVYKQDHPLDTDGQKFALFQFIAKNYISLGITWRSIADALYDIDYGDLSLAVRSKYCTGSST